MTDDQQQMFNNRYANGNTPWDTGITPPEIVDIIAERPSGKALDLGCGTGTNLRYLLDHGWQADGIDFVQPAVNTAKSKLANYPPSQYRVFCGDVTQLDAMEGLRPPYDLVIDIGCGHGIDKDKNETYARDIASLLKVGGVLMLYASHPRENSTVGWTPADVSRIFSPYLDIEWQVAGDDTSIGVPSSWYRMVKTA